MNTGRVKGTLNDTFAADRRMTTTEKPLDNHFPLNAHSTYRKVLKRKIFRLKSLSQSLNMELSNLGILPRLLNAKKSIANLKETSQQQQTTKISRLVVIGNSFDTTRKVV